MPKQTIYKPEFAQMIIELVGDLTLEQAGIRCNIAGETVRKLKKGKVPELDTIRKIADGFADRGADYDKLLIAAGYKQPESIEILKTDKVSVKIYAESGYILDEEIRLKILECFKDEIKQAERRSDNNASKDAADNTK